ncbi:conjugal transfer protein TraG N-terminal domain-containing protein [Halorhodospira halophila]|uniref:conjugal transfer protein TraG N-terminal domain-containing protein n=1 Tax=Halorhodospira halophila TaxID=1053 RepID=UPI0019116FC9|nr:conjugal transfer protein TraG N-terminal domain-containing protein [Halorhodospira halophila]MBK5944798.1 hypothetical protein [Halorhodospira halophila]
MNVQHPLEAFTLVFAWMQYETIWEILTGTGIAYIPFLVFLVQAFSDAYTGMEAKAGAKRSVHAMELRIIMAFSVVVLAAQPMIELQTSVLEYEDPCGTNSDPADTPYHDVFDNYITPAQVPAWWYGTLAIGSGITGAAIDGLGCPKDYVQTRLDFDRQRINDEQVAAEVEQFVEDCFIPARSRYQRERPDVDPLLDDYGEDDPQYIGSYVYLNTYYQRYQASKPVEGWDYEEQRSGAYYDDNHPPPHGRPYCHEWWTGNADVGLDGPGLRERILEQMEPGFWDRLHEVWADFADGTEQYEVEDAMIQRIIQNEASSAPIASADLVATDETAGQGLHERVFSTVAVGLGTAWYDTVEHGPMMYTIRSAAPMIQSFLLMGIIMLLPFLLIISLYSWQTVFVATFGIVLIKVWDYLWSVSIWLEENMVRAMHPDTLSYLAASNVGNLLSPDGGTQGTMLMIITGLLHIGLPLVFTTLMGWGGYKALNQINAASSSTTGSVQNAGTRSGQGAINEGRKQANI